MTLNDRKIVNHKLETNWIRQLHLLINNKDFIEVSYVRML